MRFLSRKRTSDSENRGPEKGLLTETRRSGLPGLGSPGSTGTNCLSPTHRVDRYEEFERDLSPPSNASPRALNSPLGIVFFTAKDIEASTFTEALEPTSLRSSRLKASALYSSSGRAIASSSEVFPHPFSPTITFIPEPGTPSGTLKSSMRNGSPGPCRR